MTVPRRARRPLAQALPVVVDASMAVQWFANEPGSETATRLLEAPAELLAPDHMSGEAANAWWKKVRRGEMGAADLDEAVVGLLAIGIAWVPTAELLPQASRLAVEIGHPVYDCLYLALAAERGARLATADVPLRRRASRMGIRLWRP